MPTPVIPRPIVAACLAALALAPARAQRPDTVAKAGTEIRMWSTRMQWTARTGKVLRWVSPDTVVISSNSVVFGKPQANTYLVPVWELDTLQMRVRPPGARTAMETSLLWGGTAGATIGAIVGFISLTANQCGTAKPGRCNGGELGVGAGFFGLIGGLAGLVIGAFVGTFGDFPDDIAWVPVAVQRPAG